MVVLGLGDDAGGLVDLLAVPHARRGLPLGQVVGSSLAAEQCSLLGDGCHDGIRLDVVLFMEDKVDRGQAGILVDAVVAGDVVRGEQRLVVLPRARIEGGIRGAHGRQRITHLVHRARRVAHVGDDGVASLLGVADL